MAGIYIHIPFCKLKCHYCDFHFSTNIGLADKLIKALVLEIKLSSNFLGTKELSTIYFGGGTPTILSNNQLSQIFDAIHHTYHLSENCEITMECNPDDLNKEKIEDLLSLGVNRLSIGTQSFEDDVLQSMNRAHNRDEAINSILMAKELGMENISIDLIYGVPGKGMDYWMEQIDQFIGLGVPHLSAYCLTIEKNTVFGNKYNKGELNLPTDETSLEQFNYMIDELKSAGYEQYEISNFSQNGYISKHNSAYWLGEKYLGIGPSAHSFNGNERSWNVANNHVYVQRMSKNEIPAEVEVLSDRDKVNEYLLTRLRTKWGVDRNNLSKMFNEISMKSFNENLNIQFENGNLLQEGSIIRLTEKGKFISDKIIAELFI